MENYLKKNQATGAWGINASGASRFFDILTGYPE